MAFTSRVLDAGKILIIVAALGVTFVVSAFIAFRFAVRSQEVTVPDLGKQTVNQASARLDEIGLTLRVDENRRIDDEVPAGQIMQQDPAAGVRVRRQRSIRVWVSQGAVETLVPSLVGETERTAQVRLQQDGLTLGAVAEIRTNEYESDAVVAQEPPPSTPGTEVALLVNRGQVGTRYVMPDLIGVDGERAAEFLRGRGFRVAVVGNQPYPGVPAGIVIRQTPAGGFQIAPGEAIALEVSQ